MFLLQLGCFASVEDREVRDRVERAVAEAGARLEVDACRAAEKAPASFGCLLRGDPDEIAKLVGSFGAQAGSPRSTVSVSPCVREQRAIAVQLPGSDDWYPRDGVATWRPASPGALKVGDLYVLGEHVCVEVAR